MSDPFKKALNDLTRKIERAAAPEDVPLPKLMPPPFMRQHTNAPSIEAFLEASGVELTSATLKSPPASLDRYVSAHTGFSSWNAMVAAAGKEYMTRKLRNSGL